MSLDSSYKFLLTTEYIFWWDDCEGYGYFSIDNVKFHGDDEFEGIFATDKSESEDLGGFIIDEDIPLHMQPDFADDMNSVVNYIQYIYVRSKSHE